MKKMISMLAIIILFLPVYAQETMTPELLLNLGRVKAMGISKNEKSIVYSVQTFDVKENKGFVKKYIIPISGGHSTEIKDANDFLLNNRISPNGKYNLIVNEVKINNVFGKDFYPKFDKSEVMVYDDLNYRHWDTWEDGSYSHVFVEKKDTIPGTSIDIMPNEPYDCPQKPFGGDEDCVWNPNGNQIVYVCKKKYGKDYALSTNTDIYAYDIESKKTINMTVGMEGYDIQPGFSRSGILAWLSMHTDGYESDKNDIIVDNGISKINLTKDWDGTVDDFKWSADSKKIFFIAPIDGTVQLFEVNYPGLTKDTPIIKQITHGDFDVREIAGQVNNSVVISRSDMNHASELFSVDITNGKMKQLTFVNDSIYKNIKLSNVEGRYINTTDGKKMFTWVIYPPNFDPQKKYPTILYCQGGPQAALTQGYSFRWNFQLMAANGYIIVAPNRRGMPGFGVKWNEQISKDYGGQVIQDYLTAIDNLSKEPFVDKSRLGCIGASYGGYSVYFLAGMHEKRFKTFIAHDGIFDWRSMYGTTEEIFFVNQDLGEAYWETNNTAAQKSYNQFNPANYVNKWDTPILIIQGEKDYRVPVEQGLSAFQAAQLKGIKSKLLYFSNENHWILKEQDALVWQREFFKWLGETLK